MVKFKNVTKTFGSIVALEDVSFEVEKGEFVFVTGPSGAGKTTLIKILLGEEKADKGEVILGDTVVSKLPKSKVPLLRREIGTIFQDFKLLPDRTVRENVEVALAVHGIDQSEWKARIEQVLKLVGLFERIDLFPAQLSGGELQKATIARALVTNPKLILADEPTGNLDWDTASEIMQLFDKINGEGKTIIMASHNVEIVDRMKKRVIKLKNGKIVKDLKNSKYN